MSCLDATLCCPETGLPCVCGCSMPRTKFWLDPALWNPAPLHQSGQSNFSRPKVACCILFSERYSLKIVAPGLLGPLLRNPKEKCSKAARSIAWLGININCAMASITAHMLRTLESGARRAAFAFSLPLGRALSVWSSAFQKVALLWSGWIPSSSSGALSRDVGELLGKLPRPLCGFHPTSPRNMICRGADCQE